MATRPSINHMDPTINDGSPVEFSVKQMRALEAAFPERRVTPSQDLATIQYNAGQAAVLDFVRKHTQAGKYAAIR